MSGACRLWLGGAQDAGVLARLHAGAIADAWPEPSFASLLSREETFVLLGAANGSDDAQGFILMRCVAEEAEVLTFCVVEGARRGGMGAALLEAACERVRGRGGVQIFLEVSQDNSGALALYQKSGFVAVGRRAAYYRHGSSAADALVMRKAISSVSPSFQVAPESTKSG